MADTALHELFDLPTGEVQFDEQQEAAIQAACDPARRVVATTGPAGTGKTLLLKEIAKRMSAAGYSVQASAPTGKASKRIQEVCGLHAMTNHRLLGYGMPIEHEEVDAKTGERRIVEISTGPSYTSRNPLPYDILLTDEYAMVNSTIHRELIDALKPGARIRMFGDVNQLKPIEEGSWYAKNRDEPSPFQAVLTKFSGIELKTIHRTQEGSGIAENAAAILKGRMPKRQPDFALSLTNQPVQALQELVLEGLENGIDYSSPQCQIITTMNKSWVGTIKLNPLVQSMFWDNTKPPLELPRHQWGKKGSEKQLDTAWPIRIQVGSKVVYTANTYDMGDGLQSYAFNGEVGIVEYIDHEFGSVTIDFGDRVVTVPPIILVQEPKGAIREHDPRKNIDLAYVLTTHKVQGSEFKRVCVVLNRSTIYNQSRRSLYTSVTRAREHCTLITDMPSLTKSTRFAD